MIRYICDLEDCENFTDTDEPKMPPGWSCDPIYKDGKFTGKMRDVCQECASKRKGMKGTLAPVDDAAVRQARAKKSKSERLGQRALF